MCFFFVDFGLIINFFCHVLELNVSPPEAIWRICIVFIFFTSYVQVPMVQHQREICVEILHPKLNWPVASKTICSEHQLPLLIQRLRKINIFIVNECEKFTKWNLCFYQVHHQEKQKLGQYFGQLSNLNILVDKLLVSHQLRNLLRMEISVVEQLRHV